MAIIIILTDDVVVFVVGELRERCYGDAIQEFVNFALRSLVEFPAANETFGSAIVA